MAIKQGDVYWVEIRAQGEAVGSEQSNRRPWVIVSRSELNGGKVVVGVPLTSRQKWACAHRIAIPAREIIKDQGSSAQIKDSVALTDQIRALDVSRLEMPRIGRLSQTATIAVVEQGLAYLFDIPL